MTAIFTLATAMRELHCLEKNCRVSSFWDDGFLIEIGDEQNVGRRACDLLVLAGDVRRGDYKRPSDLELSRWAGEGGAA
jgi:hypothetical protein